MPNESTTVGHHPTPAELIADETETAVRHLRDVADLIVGIDDIAADAQIDLETAEEERDAYMDERDEADNRIQDLVTELSSAENRISELQDELALLTHKICASD